MPIFFLLVGILLVIVAINDKLPDLTKLAHDDFVSSSNGPSFTVWIVAIIAVGAIGYVQALKPVANAFLALIIVVLILSNKGFFAQFTQTVSKA